MAKIKATQQKSNKPSPKKTNKKAARKGPRMMITKGNPNVTTAQSTTTPKNTATTTTTSTAFYKPSPSKALLAVLNQSGPASSITTPVVMQDKISEQNKTALEQSKEVSQNARMRPARKADLSKVVDPAQLYSYVSRDKYLRRTKGTKNYILPNRYKFCKNEGKEHSAANKYYAKDDKQKITAEMTSKCTGKRNDKKYGFTRRVGTSGNTLVRHRKTEPKYIPKNPYLGGLMTKNQMLLSSPSVVKQARYRGKISKYFKSYKRTKK